MKKPIVILAIVGLLSSCGGGGTNPFDKNTETGETTSPTDPSTANSKFLFDFENGLTVNSVTYDQANDQLLINNLPFDGPDQRYNKVRNQGAASIYKSRQTTTTGLIDSYAVFMRNDDMEVAAAAGSEWINFGYAGANIKRTTYKLPGGVGEYVYLGKYAATRKPNLGGELQIVTGDTRLLLDVKDFDKNGILEGALVGTVSNRVRTQAGSGAPISAPLPNISLKLIRYDASTGAFSNGAVSTSFENQTRDKGSWEGLIGGADGSNIGAYVNMTGKAEIQRVAYEVVTYIDPATNREVTLSAYNAQTDAALIKQRVENGENIGTLTVDRSRIPNNASFRVAQSSIIFESDAEAREVGVLLTKQQPTP